MKLCAASLLLLSTSEAFSPSTSLVNPTRATFSLEAQQGNQDEQLMSLGKNVAKAAATFMVGAGIFGGAAFANEIGVEVEAPTLFTGETTEVSIIKQLAVSRRQLID